MHADILEYAVNASPDEWALMSLETATLVWMAYEHIGRNQDNARNLPNKLKAWAKDARPATAPGEPDRHQPILSAILAQLPNNIESLASDEAEFCLAAHYAASLAPIDYPIRDYEHYIQPYLTPLREHMAKSRAHSGIALRSAIVTGRQLSKSSNREISKFAGIDLSFRGPVYTASGNVKVIGSIPEDCMLVADAGSCVVEGYLLGKVAALNDCDVTENIGGIVIVRKGAVRARNLVDRAVVISKQGSVECKKCLQPDLVFAGKTFVARDESVMGHIIARRIEIAGQVFGGILEATEAIKAPQFRQNDQRPLALVLREQLSCEDYGEDLSPQVRKLMSKANRLRRDIQANLQRSVALENESEEAARTALLYLTGREQINSRVEDLGRAQRRLAALDRTIMGVHSLAQAAEESLFGEELAMDEQRASDLNAMMNDDDDTDSSETVFVQAVADIRQELYGYIQQSVQRQRQRQRQPVDRGRSRRVFSDVRSKIRDWVFERAELKRNVEAIRHSIEDEDNQWASAMNLPSGTSKVHILHALLSRIRQQEVGESLRSRASSPFISVMLRTIAQRREKARFHVDTADRQQQALDQTVEALKRDSQIDLYERDARDAGAIAEGVFQEGIRILTDPNIIDEPQVPEGYGTVTTAGSSPRRFVRSIEGIIEAT